VEFRGIVSALGEPKRERRATAGGPDSPSLPRPLVRTSTASSWKTTELPPELAAALLEMEMGSQEKKESGSATPLYSRTSHAATNTQRCCALLLIIITRWVIAVTLSSEKNKAKNKRRTSLFGLGKSKKPEEGTE